MRARAASPSSTPSPERRRAPAPPSATWAPAPPKAAPRHAGVNRSPRTAWRWSFPQSVSVAQLSVCGVRLLVVLCCRGAGGRPRAGGSRRVGGHRRPLRSSLCVPSAIVTRYLCLRATTRCPCFLPPARRTSPGRQGTVPPPARRGRWARVQPPRRLKGGLGSASLPMSGEATVRGPSWPFQRSGLGGRSGRRRSLGAPLEYRRAESAGRSGVAQRPPTAEPLDKVDGATTIARSRHRRALDKAGCTRLATLPIDAMAPRAGTLPLPRWTETSSSPSPPGTGPPPPNQGEPDPPRPWRGALPVTRAIARAVWLGVARTGRQSFRPGGPGSWCDTDEGAT